MRTIVITGASDGIGAAAAAQLAHEDTRLVLVGRSPAKTRAVAARVGAEHHAVDFERLDEVRDLAAALRGECARIDVLADNAGGMFSGPALTTDGVEKTFQVNHLAPYLLTALLVDRLIGSRAAVVNTASVGARLFGRIDLDDIDSRDRFHPNRAYGNAKLANILFTRGLHARFRSRGLTAVAFHPGMIATNFASDTSSGLRRVYHGALQRFLTPPERGGAVLAHFVTGRPDRDWAPGEFHGAHGRISRTHSQAYDPLMAERHWEQSARMLGLEPAWGLA
ncbi:SDR family NAD(P)-dependent oxidoreductase [Brevibacterium album]|uniref:SDR family NAD(P)-dependent oxidoreductase n=1 Tax=Brevibacterium album TaxID=417948 RepID=UPI00042044AE|nr:SDR family NAD(P)-dependent oxidoreductase [Brevibacterium album]